MENLREYIIGTSPLNLDIALLIVRTALGVCFIVHGLGKLGVVGNGSMQGFTQWLASLKVPFPAIQARMAMATEIVCGTLLTLGLCTRPACVLLFFVMGVATFVGHKGAGYLITNNPPGNEYALNLMILQVVIFLTGAGQYSLDFYLWS